MLSNKTGVKLSGRDNKGSNANARSPNGRKVGVNSPTNVNINKSFVSTANTQGQRNAKGDNQYQDSFYNSKARDNG
jgi:hypothetical protein